MRKKFLNEIINQTSDETKRSAKEYANNLKIKVMSKEKRTRIWNKFYKKCAYCGVDLPLEKMQIDHLNPIFRNDSDERLLKMGIIRGTNNYENLYPSCARCNRWKSTYTLEKFREEISMQITRLERDSSAFRMAKDFKLVKKNYKIPIFYFETVNENKDNDKQ